MPPPVPCRREPRLVVLLRPDHDPQRVSRRHLRQRLADVVEVVDLVLVPRLPADELCVVHEHAPVFAGQRDGGDGRPQGFQIHARLRHEAQAVLVVK
jgi:hypothetical protein